MGSQGEGRAGGTLPAGMPCPRSAHPAPPCQPPCPNNPLRLHAAALRAVPKGQRHPPPPTAPAHLQRRQVGDAQRVVLAAVHHHQLPAARGRPNLHAPALGGAAAQEGGGRGGGAGGVSARMRQRARRGPPAAGGAGGVGARMWQRARRGPPATGGAGSAAPALWRQPAPALASVVGSVTWGSAMPGLSLEASAAGVALLNMPMNPRLTLEVMAGRSAAAGRAGAAARADCWPGMSARLCCWRPLGLWKCGRDQSEWCSSLGILIVAAAPSSLMPPGSCRRGTARRGSSTFQVCACHSLRRVH